MAKKSKSGSSGTKSKASKPRRIRSSVSRVRTASRKQGVKWGEVALSAIVGYEGNKILAGTQVGNLAYPYLSKIGPVNDALAAIYGEQGGSNNEITSTFINKTAGLAALLKSAYDVVKKHRLDDTDKNILIPYGIGTVFDGPKESQVSGGWK